MGTEMSAGTPVVDAATKRFKSDPEVGPVNFTMELMYLARALEAHCEAMASTDSTRARVGYLRAVMAYEQWKREQLGSTEQK